jgi:glycine/D-amino acid oxidase-like deaminating enzyme
MRAVVVGAGIVGSAVAFHLARAGVRVEVAERDRPAGGTTATSFARLSAFDKEPEAYFRLNHAGMREHAHLAAALPNAGWYHRCGSLIWESGDGRLPERVARFERWGYPLRWRDAAEIDAGLVPPSVPRVLHAPEEAWVDAPVLTRWLLAEAQRHGAQVVLGEPVAGLARAAGGGWRVVLGSGRQLSGDVVVNAAGVAAGQVAALAGVRLELVPSRGLLVDLAVNGGEIAQTVHTNEVSVRPAGPGRVMVRSDQVDRRLADESQAARETLCQDLLRRAQTAVPGLRGATVIGARVGVRVIPKGGYPSVGGVSDAPGYYQAATHSGVILAPLVGRLLAGEITRGKVHELLAPYRPTAAGGEPPER